LAEKLGFSLRNEYFYFCSFLPTENPADISEAEWAAWAKYLESSCDEEPRLINECLYGYMRANQVDKTIEIINTLHKYGQNPNFANYKRDIGYFQSFGLCSNFNEMGWLKFVDNGE
jgi:hypothetical protein